LNSGPCACLASTQPLEPCPQPVTVIWVVCCECVYVYLCMRMNDYICVCVVMCELSVHGCAPNHSWPLPDKCSCVLGLGWGWVPSSPPCSISVLQWHCILWPQARGRAGFLWAHAASPHPAGHSLTPAYPLLGFTHGLLTTRISLENFTEHSVLLGKMSNFNEFIYFYSVLISQVIWLCSSCKTYSHAD
jgi:hypothetical protein